MAGAHQIHKHWIELVGQIRLADLMSTEIEELS